MAKASKDKYTKKISRMRRHRKLRFALAMILLAIVIIVGGSFIAIVVHLKREGLLDVIETILKRVFLAKELDITFIVFWLIPIPLILAFILIVSLVRMRKYKDYRMTWEQTVKYAVEEEKKSFEAKNRALANSKRFSSLNDIVSPTIEETGEVQSLEQLCDNFRSYAAGKLGLYYTKEQIRSFISSLAVSRLLILQGMSGTGKTSLAYAFGQYLDNPSTIIPVQPTWKERADMLGYFNEFTKKYNETPMLKKIYEANGSNMMYITVLDEMNVARVEYYFAEFLSLLEIPNAELRNLEVVPDVWEGDPKGLKNGRVRLPENMWFIGTANNDDSTFSISDKVYDRAMIIDLDTRAHPFKVEVEPKRLKISYDEFVRLYESALSGYELTRRNEKRLERFGEYLAEKFQIAYGNRILKQIRNYVALYVSSGGKEIEALDDILCKKVLRKLAYQDISRIRGDIIEMSKYMDELFGEGKMPCCKRYLSSLTHGE